jgi:outer membrane receptor protein involved in Fe transport
MLLQPSDELSVRLAVFGQKIERDGGIAVDYNLATGKPVNGELEVQNALPEPFEQEFMLASGTVNYAFDFADLTSVTSYQTAKVKSAADGSDLYVPLLGQFGIELSAFGVADDIQTDKFTQELRLAATGEKLDWLVGAFYTNEDSDRHQVAPAFQLDGTPSPLNMFDARIPSTYEEVAGFATLTWHATDKLDVTGGLRYAHNSQEQQQLASSDIGLGSDLPKRESSEDITTYLANVRYKVNDNVMPYLRVATGYRPGGPNLVLNDPETGLPVAPPTFKSDSLISYEGGIKAGTSDRRYTVDAAVYQIDWDDLQIVAVRNAVGVVANASAARSRGAELTLTAAPTDELTLSGAFGYMQAELSEDSPPTDLNAKKGDSLPDTPEFTAAVSADYDFKLGAYDSYAGATFRYIDKRISSVDQTGANPPYELPSYESVDLRGGIQLGSTQVQLYVKNLLDERGQLSAFTGFTAAGGPANVSIMQPRTYGVSVNVGF